MLEQCLENGTILILPRSLHEDIKRRLGGDEIIHFLSTLDLTNVQDANRIKYLLDNPLGFKNGWVSTEVNYLLHGRETSDGLICTGNHFHYYNFFMYIDVNDAQQLARKDICEADMAAPHVHALVYNPDTNTNKEEDFLGTLHNHPHFGFASRRRMKTIDAVGFSPDDERWNEWYLEKYGADKRKLAFVIYYSDNDFYMGVARRRSEQPKFLEIGIS